MAFWAKNRQLHYPAGTVVDDNDTPVWKQFDLDPRRSPVTATVKTSPA